MNCCFCGKELKDYGNFATPIMEGKFRCCDECNDNIVVSFRHFENFSYDNSIYDKDGNIKPEIKKINNYIEKNKIKLNIDMFKRYKV